MFSQGLQLPSWISEQQVFSIYGLFLCIFAMKYLIEIIAMKMLLVGKGVYSTNRSLSERTDTFKGDMIVACLLVIGAYSSVVAFYSLIVMILLFVVETIFLFDQVKSEKKVRKVVIWLLFPHFAELSERVSAESKK